MALSTQQVVNISQPGARPIYLVRIAHSGTLELLSASGRVEYNGELYLPGITVANIQDGENADLTLPATAARVSEVENGTWRHGICQIIHIPAALEAAAAVYDEVAATLQLDGLIDVSSWGGGEKITLRAVQRGMDGNFTPRNLISEFCNHLPAPGTVFIWNGNRITLDVRR